MYYMLSLSVPHISLNGFIAEVMSDPLVMLQFLIPLLIVVVGVLTLKVHGARSKINTNPSMVQEREVFELPDDNFYKEMMYVDNGDSDHFEQTIEKNTKEIISSTKVIKNFARRYKRLKYRLQYTNSKRKKEKMDARMKAIMKEMLRIYGNLEKDMLKLDLNKLGDE